MKREVMIAASAAAILGVALAGCSSSKSVSTPNGAVAAAGASNTKVSVDGHDQSVKGTVACTTAAGDLNIAIGGSTPGAGGVPTGIGAVLTDANPPVVKSVALGNVNGVSLGSWRDHRQRQGHQGRQLLQDHRRSEVSSRCFCS